jgi:transposase
VLTGIVFVLKTGIPWEDLPREMGCGSGMTCWRRMHEWTERGVWLFILQHLHQWLGEAGRIDWERASVDSSLVPAKRGAKIPDPTRVTEAARAANIT